MALYAFDGTGQNSVDQEEHEYTNVTRFFGFYAGSQHNFYSPGPGLERSGPLTRFVGSFVGVGSDERISAALEFLRDAFSRGDKTIDIVGYSRGAASALVFAWHLGKPSLAKELGDLPKVRFLGLWDTVFYMMPLADLPLRQRWRVESIQYKSPTNFDPERVRFDKRGQLLNAIFSVFRDDADLDLPPNVEKACHALALNVPIDLSKPGSFFSRFFRNARIAGAEEVWFAGSHPDVGGGSPNRRLSDASLAWMAERAVESGVELEIPDLLGPSDVDNTARAIVDWTNPIRPFREDDILHPSALAFGADVIPPLTQLRRA